MSHPSKWPPSYLFYTSCSEIFKYCTVPIDVLPKWHFLISNQVFHGVIRPSQTILYRVRSNVVLSLMFWLRLKLLSQIHQDISDVRGLDNFSGGLYEFYLTSKAILGGIHEGEYCLSQFFISARNTAWGCTHLFIIYNMVAKSFSGLLMNWGLIP